MKKYVITAILLLFSTWQCYSQNVSNTSPLDTLGSMVFGVYPEIFKSNKKYVQDSLASNYPNRTKIAFATMSKAQRDSIVNVEWHKFKDALLEAIDEEAIEFPHKKNYLFFTLYFNTDGGLDYLLYNWTYGRRKGSPRNEEFDEEFIKFASQYDYRNFPKGKFWSQCGTIEVKTKKK